MKIEEVQDILAEFENRISYLENSNTTAIPIKTPPIIPAEPLEFRPYKKLIEIEGLARNTRMKIQAHLQSHSSKKGLKHKLDITGGGVG